MSDRERFLTDYNVPRGTALLFDRYAALLIEWQTRMNLVAPSTIDRIWNRHFADSAQLVALTPSQPRRWLDIGAGAGFPGLVVALLSKHRVTLVESIEKKCRFLQEVIDQLRLANIDIRNGRVETAAQDDFEIISARACAPLARLFELGEHQARPTTCWLLLKGETVASEIEQARITFNFNAALIPSQTDPRGRIVMATEVRRRSKRR